MPTDMKSPGEVENGFNHDGVKSALKLIEKNSLTHNKQENIWRVIQDLFTMQFNVQNPAGTRQISSKTMMQVVWKAVNKMKPLDFELHGSGAKEWLEKLVTDGVGTVMEEGNYAQCLRDKGGAFWKMMTFGDSFVQIGTFEDLDYPIQFRTCSLSDVYMDNQANDIRDAAGGMSATEMVLIYRYSWENFKGFFPQYADKVAIGNIPRSLRWRKQLEKTWLQTLETDEQTIEVAYRFNCATKELTIFAGSACVVLEDITGKDYPWQVAGKGYIPVAHFKCFPSQEGFYNYGLGQLLYDLCIVTARLDNMAVRHANDNVDPITIVGVPNGQATKFFQKVIMAHNQRTKGGKGYVVQDNDAAGNKESISVDALQTPPITNEWERVFNRLDQMITRLGFNLDGADLGANVTATQIMYQEDMQDGTIKQIQEFNASEYKFVVDTVMDMMAKTIDSEDDTPVNMTTEISEDGATAKVQGITLGMVADELRKRKWFCRVNSRSGAIPSNVMKLAKNQSAISMATPGTPIFNKLAAQRMNLFDIEAKPEDFNMAAPAPAQGMQGTTGAIPSQTESNNLAKEPAMI